MVAHAYVNPERTNFTLTNESGIILRKEFGFKEFRESLFGFG